MSFFANPIQWILGTLFILSSLGVILAKKPVYASLSFLLTLMHWQRCILQLSAEFIAVMQVLGVCWSHSCHFYVCHYFVSRCSSTNCPL